MILSAQLLLTAGLVSASCFHNGYVNFVKSNVWLIIVAAVISIITMYVLVYVRTAARKVPVNYILLFLFTICEAYLVSSITAEYEPVSVFIAAALTAAIVVALTIYACTTKTDFTICGGLLFTCLMALFIASFMSIFFYNYYVEIIISALSVVLFSVYLIYDTQLILGKGELKLQIDDYIFAAMNLYIDIIRIFLEILRLVGSARS